MLLGLLRQSFTNQKRAMALMVASVAMGTAISASLITISLDIRGKVSRELRSFGANIIIEPAVEGFADLAGQKRYIREEDFLKAKTIFWRHNIVGLAPFLEGETELLSGGVKKKVVSVGTWFKHELPLPGEDATFDAGVETVSPWWEVNGSPPVGNGALLGVSLAGELGAEEGDEVLINGHVFRVSGTLSTGGKEDRRVFIDLHRMQSLLGRPGGVSRVLVSALTTPMDDFAYQDPKTMTKVEYEKWYCTGYITSIAKQLEEVFKNSRAKPVWQVAETEGRVMQRLSVLVYLLAASALFAGALGMSTTMAVSLLRRLDEIGLMKALGADSVRIITIFLSEAFVIGLVGGLLGYALSVSVSHYIGLKVFGAALADRGMLLPVSLLSAFLMAALGSLLPVRRALGVEPAVVLKWAR
jgi:putative ABC transport system permease protein